MAAQRILVPALLVAALLACGPVRAQAKKSDSVVKATAKSAKAGGKTTVTITLDIDPAFHLYANPVGNDDYLESQTAVSFTADGKKVAAKVTYPAGMLKKEKGGDYRIYKGKVTITCAVDAEGPLEAQVKVSACDKNTCLPPGAIKLKVD